MFYCIFFFLEISYASFNHSFICFYFIFWMCAFLHGSLSPTIWVYLYLLVEWHFHRHAGALWVAWKPLTNYIFKKYFCDFFFLFKSLTLMFGWDNSQWNAEVNTNSIYRIFFTFTDYGIKELRWVYWEKYWGRPSVNVANCNKYMKNYLSKNNVVPSNFEGLNICSCDTTMNILDYSILEIKNKYHQFTC